MTVDQGLAVRAELFGTVFVLVQNLSRRVDVALRPLGLTSRQWLLLAVLKRGFPDRAPSLTEAAGAYGSSRQNVKRIAEQLARRGYLRLVADPSDRRPTRLELTDRVLVLDGQEVTQAEFLLESMAGLEDDQLRQLRDLALTWLRALSTDGATPDALNGDGVAGDGLHGDGLNALNRDGLHSDGLHSDGLHSDALNGMDGVTRVNGIADLTAVAAGPDLVRPVSG